MIEKKRLAAGLVGPCGTTWVVCSSLYMLTGPPAVCWICFLLGALRCPGLQRSS